MIGRRDFLKGLGGFVAGILASVKVERPPGDTGPEAVVPGPKFPIANVDPVYWELAASVDGAPSSFCIYTFEDDT